jgi:predicted GNAT family acetyltransferase
MEITHLPEDNLFKTVVDGYTAYVTYIIRDGKLDIRHTIVPPEIGGRGIAAQLVKATYDYALQHHLQPLAPMLSFGCKDIRNITATPEKITEDAAVVLCNRK